MLVSKLRPEATQRLVDIVGEPLHFPDDAKPVRSTGRKTIWAVSLDDAGEPRSLFVKIYRPRGGLPGLKEIFRESAGLQTWAIAEKVLAAGIETPVPRAAGDRRTPDRRLVFSFYACDHLKDAQPLVALTIAARGWEEERREEFATKLGAAFHTLDLKGFVQPDLKPTNFLVRHAEAGAFTLLPIDLRRCRFGVTAVKRAREKTDRQLRDRVLEGWPSQSIAAFFAARG